MQIIVEKQKVNFEVYGQGKPIIYLHGWGSNLKTWYSLVNKLPQNYSHILIDLPGFGESTFPTKIWGLFEYVNFLNALFKELDINNPYIVGHSFGGKIATKFAATNNNLRKLILIAPSGVDSRSSYIKFKIAILKLLKIIFSKNVTETLKDSIGSVDYKTAGQLRNVLNKVTNEKIIEDLSNVPVPTLILWGDKDNTLSVKQGKIFENSIADAYLKIIWETKHYPHIEEPLETAKAIKEFINE
ncbi:alpha/beta fold hydrolase [Patescibacteria group bacterium]